MSRCWVSVLLWLGAAREAPVLAQSCADYSQHPEPVGSVDTPGANAVSVAIQAEFAYLATVAGLCVLDIRNPVKPVLVGSLPGFARAVAVEDTTAYLTGDGSLRVVDIRDPSAPAIVGTVSTPAEPRAMVVGWATGLAVAGDLLCVAAGPFLHVLDVRDSLRVG